MITAEEQILAKALAAYNARITDVWAQWYRRGSLRSGLFLSLYS